MKQKSNWHVATILVRNLARLFWAIVCHSVIELKFKAKWLSQDTKAVFHGYKSHTAYMQKMLNHNQRIYGLMKQYEEGFMKGGILKNWKEATLY